MNRPRGWAIKLGSAGRCIPFCEERGIVGLGWSMVDPKILVSATRQDLRSHVAAVCGWYQGNSRSISAATGTLWRFARECVVDDIIAYYDPANKAAVFTRVTSAPLFRGENDGDPEIDIWHHRKVEVLCRVPILDLHGSLKGRLLGPRGSFWELRPSEVVVGVATGEVPGPSDPEILEAYEGLVDLVFQRARALGDRDWEVVVADYFRLQGAVIEGRIGGSQPIIDAEARFDHGALGSELWRIQVKRYEDRQVDWPEIAADFERAGEPDRFCYVSVFGFTDEAKREAESQDVELLDGHDLAWFLLSGRIREELRRKLGFPALVP